LPLRKRPAHAFRCILYDTTDRIRAEKAQNLYYSIASLTTKSDNLETLYQNIHKELSKVIEVKNFYITLYNSEKNYLYFPYYVDEDFDGEVRLTQRRVGRGLTEYAMFYNKPLFLYEEQIVQLAAEHNLELYGAIPKVWLGVPLKIENRITGIIAVKCYRSRTTYSIRDLELLDFISGQIALAIERKQNEEKLHKQTARLNAIFESGTHLMWSVNRKMLLTSFNQNYSESIEQQYGIRPVTNVNLDRVRSELLNDPQFVYLEPKYTSAFLGQPQYFETQVKTSWAARCGAKCTSTPSSPRTAALRKCRPLPTTLPRKSSPRLPSSRVNASSATSSSRSRTFTTAPT
jgi:PAS domain-containing protein